MGNLLAKRTVVGLKTEATEGTAIALTSADYLKAEDVDVKVVAEKHERLGTQPSLDQQPHVTGKRHHELTLRTEIKGSGAAGTAYAPLGAALQACGMTETIVASTSVTYAPTSVAASASYQGPGKSATIKAYKDGKEHVMAGARGNAKIMITAGGIAYIEHAFRGLYAAVTDVALPAPSYLTTLPPSVINASFTLHGYSAVISKLEIDFANEIAMRDSVNAATGVAGFLITGRKPTGSCDPEEVLVASHDFWGKFISGVEASLSIQIGSVAGNICTITCPKVQYREVSYAERNGIGAFEVGLQFNQNTGDDWISIVFT